MKARRLSICRWSLHWSPKSQSPYPRRPPGAPPATWRLAVRSARAVKAYQQQRGLAPDGIVGEKTWTCLLGAG
ncbi:MAG: peptidoglycan-binding protein [Lachnospiraceae bacterium]|nr:peptidoglycan-binding protein [Lachnospiraceae bacterium]